MNPTLPTGWPGRGLALGLLLVVLAMVYLVVAAPLLDVYAEREAVFANRRGLLTKLSAVAAELPALNLRVTELQSAVDSHQLALPGASDAIASAALQGRIERDAAAAGMTIGSTEILPAQSEGDYRRIGLRLLLSGPYENLIKLVASLETATPPLVIDNLQIRGVIRRLGGPAPTGLDASLDAYGFRIPNASDRKS